MKLENLKIKFGALVLAGLFWVFVVISMSQMRTFPTEGGIVPEIFNLPKDLTVSSELSAVKLKINTDQAVLERLTKDNFSVFIDLKGYTSGVHSVRISAITDNPLVTIQRLEPAEIEVTLEEITSKEIPVSVNIEGNPSPNFELKEPVLEFERVMVSGAKSKIEQASEAIATVKLSGKEEGDILKTWPLDIYDNELHKIDGLTLEKSNIAVTIPLKQVTVTKTVSAKVKLIGAEENKNYYVSKITSDPLFIDIRGESSVLQNINLIETKPIDVSKINRNTTNTVNWDLPTGVSLAQTSPKVAIVSLEVTKQESVRKIPAKITAQNSSKTFEPSTITLTVSGPIEELDKLDSDNFQVRAGEFDPNVTTLEITKDLIIVPQGFTVVDFDPKSVEVK